MKKDELLKLYHEMVLVRRLEEKSAELYQGGKIGGFLHLYIGQEAVGTGVISARKPGDRVITAYRDHGIAISCGIEAKVVMAELLGKATGCSKGKGGSMHLADVERNFWGGHAIVGAHLPLAAGMAQIQSVPRSQRIRPAPISRGTAARGKAMDGRQASRAFIRSGAATAPSDPAAMVSPTTVPE